MKRAIVGGSCAARLLVPSACLRPVPLMRFGFAALAITTRVGCE